MLIGITRVRNEALILADTLRHFLAYCDCIVLYDDCSTDNTVEIAQNFNKVVIIAGGEWRNDRVMENTRHRAILLQRAKQLGADWCLCFDADERLIGDLPNLSACGYKFRLFDGYLTNERQEHYVQGDLALLPRMWGPEFRDIVMLFRTDCAIYNGIGQRAPTMSKPVAPSNVYVKHFGKCLSIEHWEETCAYYALHFPEPYRSKWKARRGKALHTVSDFGAELYMWQDLMLHRYKVWRRI